MDAVRLWEALVEVLRTGRVPRRAFIGECVRLGLSATAAAAWLQGCRRADRNAPRESGAEPPLERSLNIYNWSDYIADDTIPNFEREFGIGVTYDTFESNEEMLAKIQAGATGYDLIVPTNYMVEILIKSARLEPLNHTWLPNLQNLERRFLSPPFDPGNRYSVAYQWGTSGIAYRSDLVRTVVDSWRALWDKTYSGKMTMLDDAREVIGAALKLLGYSVNSTDEAQLAQAERLCLEQKKLLKAYVSAPVKSALIVRDVWIAQLWSGDTFQSAKEEPAIRYAIPKEGSAMWSDSLCILHAAPHKRAAHAFIDYVLRPEVAAAISNRVGYGCPNAAALPLLREDLRTDPALYPPEDVLQKLEWAVDLGEATRLYDRLWTRIKAA